MANFTAGAVLTASALNSAFNAAVINAQTGTSYTFGTADAGELVTLSNASGGTATIPANSTWGAATGTIIDVLNAGTAGTFTIGTAAGVTLNASSVSLAPLESGQLVKTATNTWYFARGGGLNNPTLTGNVVWSAATLRASTASVGTNQTTTTTTYTDLATSGPAVTVTTGTKALVTLTAALQNNGSSACFVSFAVSGATTVAAADDKSIFIFTLPSNGQVMASSTFLITGLTAGSNTFTMKYRVSGGTGSFVYRHISVVDMGS